MDLLKRFWPQAFKAKDVAGLVVTIIIYLAINCVCALIGWVIGILPLVGGILGTIWGIIGWVIGIYCVVGIVLAILAFAKVLK